VCAGNLSRVPDPGPLKALAGGGGECYL